MNAYLHGCNVLLEESRSAVVGAVPFRERPLSRFEITAIVLGALSSIVTVMQFIMFLERRK